MDMKEIEILKDNIDRHWYYKSKALYLKNYIKEEKFTKLLDIGAGSGFFSHWLIRHWTIQEATCVDVAYDRDKEEYINGKLIRYRNNQAYNNVDLALMMDVLEHVDNDVDFLKEYLERVPQSCFFVITVPAFEFLWSQHDVYLGHKRRYNLKTLRVVLNKAGLKVEKINYCFGLIFPLAVILRLSHRVLKKKSEPKSDLKQHSKIVNHLLFWLCLLEVPFVKFNKIAGLSIVCKCRRP